MSPFKRPVPAGLIRGRNPTVWKDWARKRKQQEESKKEKTPLHFWQRGKKVFPVTLLRNLVSKKRHLCEHRKKKVRITFPEFAGSIFGNVQNTHTRDGQSRLCGSEKRKSMPHHSQPLTIQKIKRTNKRIFIAYMNGTEKLTVNSDENALPEFHEALVKLGSLIEIVLHVPTAWTLENLRVIGLTMGTQGEAHTVSILGQKSLSDASKAFNIVTPPRLLQHPTEPGSYTPPLTAEQADVVYALIEAAKNYVVGNRAQGMLPGMGLDEAEEDGDYSDEAPGLQNLPFETLLATEEAATKRKRKSRKTA